MDRRTFSLTLAGGLLAAAAGRHQWAAHRGTGPGGAVRPRRLLVLAQAAGYRHDSIPAAVAAFESLGRETGAWEVVARAETAAEVGGAVTAERLAAVDGVVFANTTGDLAFTREGRAAFLAWMRQGGAFIGVHSAADTFRGDADYLSLLGGEFLTHGPQVEVTILVEDPSHPACAALPPAFRFHDEIYEFQHWRREAVHTLLSMDRHPQDGTPGDFPVAWTKRYGAGRVFYTSLGHREDAWANPLLRQHVTGGVLWALGLAAR